MKMSWRNFGGEFGVCRTVDEVTFVPVKIVF